MINTGKVVDLPDDVKSFLLEMSKTFEFYLPDEKISSLWQETELISTVYTDFEAVYFERELDIGWMYVSQEFEFFPLYILYLTIKYGVPSFIYLGVIEENEIIKISTGSEVLVVGFEDQGSEGNLKQNFPPVSNLTPLDLLYIKSLAQPYLEEII